MDSGGVIPSGHLSVAADPTGPDKGDRLICQESLTISFDL